jgi:adenylosuccinate synthase
MKISDPTGHAVVVDLQLGDCAKGKVVAELISSGKYTHGIRFNGTGNAGHTVYLDGKKIKTHYVPSSVVYGRPSYIGPQCFIHVKNFLEEVKYLELMRPDARSLIKIARQCHIISDEHIAEDVRTDTIGSTGKGMRPGSRDKYAKSSDRAEDIPELRSFLYDPTDKIKHFTTPNNLTAFGRLFTTGHYAVCEGAQSHFLDITYGHYPYCSSGHSLAAAAGLNGIPFMDIERVYGVAKPYMTYVGTYDFENWTDYESTSEFFKYVLDEGLEYGTTTGRPRKLNWMNINALINAANMNCVTHLIINKMDIFEGAYSHTGVPLGIYEGEGKDILTETTKRRDFKDPSHFKEFVEDQITMHCPRVKEIIWSYSKYSV